MLDLLVESQRLDGVGDARLVVAIARRQPDALAEVYRRHAGAVLGLARRVLGDPRLSEEVVQEVFLGLWRAPDGFDPDRGSLRSYLLAQTHGKSVDMVRAEVSRRGREEREARLRAKSGYDLEREVWDITMADRVRRTLEELPEPERRAIELAYFGGQTYREVAVTLGEPEGTIKTRRLTRWLPIASAAAILLVGFVLTGRAVAQL
jgi:RNA polymerase sigma-70 factor, ECF subfamily